MVRKLLNINDEYVEEEKSMILYENSIGNFVKSAKERNLVNYMLEEYWVRFSRKVSAQKNTMEMRNGSAKRYSCMF